MGTQGIQYCSNRIAPGLPAYRFFYLPCLMVEIVNVQFEERRTIGSPITVPAFPGLIIILPVFLPGGWMLPIKLNILCLLRYYSTPLIWEFFNGHTQHTLKSRKTMTQMTIQTADL